MTTWHPGARLVLRWTSWDGSPSVSQHRRFSPDHRSRSRKLIGTGEHGGRKVRGLDHSATLLEVAAEKNRKALDDGRLRLIEADATRMPFEEREFSKIGMVQVFMMLTEPVAVLAECRRVLRPGGVLVSIVGVEPEYRPTTDVQAHRAREDGRLESLARKAGFDDIEISWNRYGGQTLRCRTPDR